MVRKHLGEKTKKVDVAWQPYFHVDIPSVNIIMAWGMCTHLPSFQVLEGHVEIVVLWVVQDLDQLDHVGVVQLLHDCDLAVYLTDG